MNPLSGVWIENISPSLWDVSSLGCMTSAQLYSLLSSIQLWTITTCFLHWHYCCWTFGWFLVLRRYEKMLCVSLTSSLSLSCFFHPFPGLPWDHILNRSLAHETLSWGTRSSTNIDRFDYAGCSSVDRLERHQPLSLWIRTCNFLIWPLSGSTFSCETSSPNPPWMGEKMGVVSS